MNVRQSVGTEIEETEDLLGRNMHGYRDVLFDLEKNRSDTHIILVQYYSPIILPLIHTQNQTSFISAAILNISDKCTALAFTTFH